MKIFNTLTRKKEEFKPISEKAVTMYSCGPTVYNFAHIGNLRTYIFMDLLRRALQFNGYRIKGVLNITDVGHLLSDADEGEDKMAKAAAEQKKSPYELAEFYTKVFMDDIAALNIGRPEIIPKATEHIKEMLDYVVTLEKKGYAYETSDGIYFDISKFSSYGKLSGINLEEQQAGARVEVNPEKRSASDFALWKKADPQHIMQWDSPWGRGYPGWHIECSAMSKKYLGAAFDIHSGGVDHIPIHHENEIAQSEALEGKKTVNVWMHGEFMLVDGGKMSKSLGNTYTLSQLSEKGYSPLDFRCFCLNAHYRKTLNFTFEGLSAAKTACERLRAQLYKHKNAEEVKGEGRREKGEVADKDNENKNQSFSLLTSHFSLQKYLDSFTDAINDDLNVPLALGVLWTMIKEVPPSRAVYDAALYMDKIFGLDLDKITAPETEKKPAENIPAEITALAGERLLARKNKDFARSDALRAEIISRGYEIIDVPGGYTLARK